MVRSDRWQIRLLTLVGAAALVTGLSAQDVARVVSQGVVTPDNPIFGVQDPAPAPSEPETPTPPAQAPAAQAPAAAPGRGGRGGGQRTYAQLRQEARMDDGLFKVHRAGDSVYFEIPKSELGKDQLWVTQIKRTTLGAGYGGQSVTERVVRWDLQTGQPTVPNPPAAENAAPAAGQNGQNGQGGQGQNGRGGQAAPPAPAPPTSRVFLKLINYDITADPSKPIAQAVADANQPAILRSFNVIVTSPDGNPVIDVTTLLMQEVTEFSPRTNLGARGMDGSRSYLEKVVSFPENINAQVTQTFTGGAADPTAAGVGRGRAGMRGASGTIVLFHSLVKLPEKPMMARLFDSRVGYFTTSTMDYGRDEDHKAVEREFISRYRLEKKDPDAPLSDPVKPIVYYIDPATPAKLVPFVKKGVEDWQVAFREAGFSNAVIAKDAPTKEQDPDWDPEDVRYSVIRWLPSTTENASGPHVGDPRSGEILEADIQMYHNVQTLSAMWYITQVGALDPRAQKLPLPDDLMGRLVQFVVAHEVGHTLGLRHNMRASSVYTIEQVRDKNWVKENSHTPSIMDYSRFNYVAQPEDGIPVDDLVPRIGPYDKWAVAWGYKPIPSAKTSDEEKATLHTWAREQETKPYLRFMTSNEGEGAAFPFDPGQQREAVGDADPTRATELGLRNLRRIADLLVTVGTSRSGESYDDLSELYARVVTQWRTELGHVTSVVGGTDSKELYVGQPGVRFAPVSRVKQAAAVQFLLENGFKVPTYLTKPDLLRRVEPTGIVARVRTAQNSLLNALLQNARLDRMAEQSLVDGSTYTPVQFLTDLRTGIWEELATPAKPIDLYRRNTQRAYLDTIDARLNEGVEPSEEVRALLRGELRALDQRIQAALPAVTDVATRRHLADAREAISTSLDPRAMRTRGGAAAALAGRGAGAGPGASATVLVTSDRYDYENDPFLAAVVGCWADLTIR